MIEVIGVYPINEDVHLIEVRLQAKPSELDMGKFTQENPDLPRGSWQVAYDEQYLNESGDQVIGDGSNMPEEDRAPTRVAFFLYFVTFNTPLRTPMEEIRLPSPTPLPERLKNIIHFVDVD